MTIYAPLDPADIAALSGREVLQGIIDGRLPAAPISEPLTFRLVEVGEGMAAFEGDPGPHLLNPMGTVHGGWALTLMDSVTACAAYTLAPAGTFQTTVETKTNFVRPITLATGTVRAEAKVVAAGRQLVTTEGRILDHSGRVLAHGTSTVMVLAAG